MTNPPSGSTVEQARWKLGEAMARVSGPRPANEWLEVTEAIDALIAAVRAESAQEIERLRKAVEVAENGRIAISTERYWLVKRAELAEAELSRRK